MRFPDFLDIYKDEQGIDPWKNVRKVRHFFIIVGIVAFILLLFLGVPIGMIIFIELCIGFIWMGYQIQTLGEGINTGRARIKKLFVMGIPVIILTGFIVLGIEHHYKTSRTDVLKISREFTIWFIQGNRSNTLKYCWDESKERIGKDFDKLRSFEYIGDIDFTDSLTSLVAFSKFGHWAVTTYETTRWGKPVLLTTLLLNGHNYSLWDEFLSEVNSIDYLGYFFPSPSMADFWAVFDFKADDEFEKIVKEDFENTARMKRIVTLKSKSEKNELSENEKREYEEYERERKESFERSEYLMKRFSDKDYREQWERKVDEVFSNWSQSEIQRQLEQTKAWRIDFEKNYQKEFVGP